SLAAFTSAIISANVSAAPLDVWRTAMDRGSATVIGILFALFASAGFAQTDDTIGDLARSIRDLAIDQLDWSAKQLKLTGYDQPMDAPFTARILRLDETCINAIAERPALTHTQRWFRGVPTALLSLQSAALSLRGKFANPSVTDRASALHMVEDTVELL